MDRFQLVGRFGGTWDGSNYIGGRMKPFTLAMDSTYEDLVSSLCRSFRIDRTQFDVRIHFVSNSPTVHLFEIDDDASFDFMKIDDCGKRFLNIETVDRDSVPQQTEVEEAQFDEGHQGFGIDGGVQFVQNFYDQHTVAGEQDNQNYGSGWNTWEHQIPDPSSLFLNYDFGDDVLPVGGEAEPVPPNGGIGLNALFYRKQDLLRAVGLYALESKFEHVVKRSDKGRFVAICKAPGCCFSIRARSTSSEGMWVIYKFEERHSCERNIQQCQGRRVSAATIGQLYASKIVGAKHAPNNIIQDMQHNYGVRIGYTKAWRGLERAKELAYGTPEDSYMYLPSYMFMLERINPGTRTSIHTVDGHFMYSFVALGASIDSFRRYMRPVIVVDAAHLKGVYEGKIYSAVCADGNGKIFPLAFGFGPEEGNESWEWFIRRVREAFGRTDDLVVVSDRHVGIQHAMGVVYPDIPHVFCYVHLKKNLIGNYCKHPSVPALLKNAMYAYRVEDCDRHLREIRRMSANAYAWLITVVKRARWARAYCPNSRYNHMTSNYVESFNKALNQARKMPITAAHEFYRALVQRWFSERRAEAEAMPNNITSYALQQVERTGAQVIRCQVSVIRVGDVYNVYHPVEGGATVTLSTRSCDCRKWDLDGIPCVHACAAAGHCNVSIRSLCSRYFDKEALIRSYEQSINPVPHISTWCAPTAGMDVLPPLHRRDAGRPREGRFLSHSERRHRRKKCSNCGTVGHNRKRCSSSGSSSGNPSNPSSVPTEQSRVSAGNSSSTSQRRCTRCGEVGHTRRSIRCPRLQLDEAVPEEEEANVSSDDDIVIPEGDVDTENSDPDSGSDTDVGGESIDLCVDIGLI